ncbi:MAG TPA: dihydroorotate dehydrogenase electron transfer subunit [Candidatus Acidoferrum sp.]|nr:dihydroorotate dehydrogenase electron transfer subunit [Candidatus Acidoferrum sp.]
MSAYRIADNSLRGTRILSTGVESPTVKTFTFRDRRCARARPGQFLMLWIPGVDEIPLSIMDADEDMTTVVVKKIGSATEALHGLKAGDVIGIRGPFGNCFTLRKGKLLLVGGGTGIAPLAFLAKRLNAKQARSFVVMGAKSREELLFLDKIRRLCPPGDFVATTENGSYGTKCLATEPLDELMTKRKFDMIYACGPEQMLRRVFDLAENHGIDMEVSLERIMRCAVGLCGSCIIGKYRVCRDGPVFTKEKLREVKDEFGLSKRDFDGRRISI